MCMLCLSEEKTRFIPLYVFGSEGLHVCHACEMRLVEFARKLSQENGKHKIQVQLTKYSSSNEEEI